MAKFIVTLKQVCSLTCGLLPDSRKTERMPKLSKEPAAASTQPLQTQQQSRRNRDSKVAPSKEI